MNQVQGNGGLCSAAVEDTDTQPTHGSVLDSPYSQNIQRGNVSANVRHFFVFLLGHKGRVSTESPFLSAALDGTTSASGSSSSNGGLHSVELPSLGVENGTLKCVAMKRFHPFSDNSQCWVLGIFLLFSLVEIGTMLCKAPRAYSILRPKARESRIENDSNVIALIRSSPHGFERVA